MEIPTLAVELAVAGLVDIMKPWFLGSPVQNQLWVRECCRRVSGVCSEARLQTI